MSETKLAQATKIFDKHYGGLSRKDIITAIMAAAGITYSHASTYYQQLKTSKDPNGLNEISPTQTAEWPDYMKVLRETTWDGFDRKTVAYYIVEWTALTADSESKIAFNHAMCINDKLTRLSTPRPLNVIGRKFEEVDVPDMFIIDEHNRIFKGPSYER